MQARNPCELFCLQKAWHAQFLRKEPRIVCAAMPQMPSENQRRGRGMIYHSSFAVAFCSLKQRIRTAYHAIYQPIADLLLLVITA
jgi:hypothetical protein